MPMQPKRIAAPLVSREGLAAAFVVFRPFLVVLMLETGICVWENA
jgi:hypothetical protein